jgi:hypothetical protein
MWWVSVARRTGGMGMGMGMGMWVWIWICGHGYVNRTKKITIAKNKVA